MGNPRGGSNPPFGTILTANGLSDLSVVRLGTSSEKGVAKTATPFLRKQYKRLHHGNRLGFRVIATPDLLMEALKEKVVDIQEFEIFVRGLAVENRISSALAELYLMEGRKHVKG